FALLGQAFAPGRRTHGVDYDGVGHAHDSRARPEQAKVQVRILAPRPFETLVETAEALEHRVRHEAVRGHELRRGEARGVALVVGRGRRERHYAAARRGVYGRVRGCRGETCIGRGEPVRIGNRVVVREGHDLALRLPPTEV